MKCWSAGLIGLLAGCLAALAAFGGQVRAQELSAEAGAFPHYMQSPVEPAEQPSRRATIPAGGLYGGGAAAEVTLVKPQAIEQQPQMQPPQLQQPQQPQPPGCLYERRHFARFDQCLERKPYPTIGLPAFKNDDLLAAGSGGGHAPAASGLADRHGCSFVLTNGLFKHYQLAKYQLEQDAAGDSKCLDDGKLVQMSMQFHNVTLYYLWQLRCLNQANQLLDDATLNGRTSSLAGEPGSSQSQGRAICVGSSQNFGFASLQLSQVEAQVELAIDIYKNWRVTNITLAMVPASGGGSDNHAQQQQQETLKAAGTSIRDFTFETLDGDELNWRYLALYENWTRNRLHTNFLEQFRRFVWISLQRCLSESSERLPVKLVELFGQQRYS